MNKHIIILDIETTGLSPKTCEITEIGAIKVDAHTLEVVEEFESLVKINGEVPYFITNLTGITNQLLKQKGNPLREVLENLSSFCSGHNVYAHNASFDKSFIRHYLAMKDIDYIESEWIDTISIFRKAFPGRKTYKLESLIQDFNLADKEDHRAISDAKYTLKLLKKALK